MRFACVCRAGALHVPGWEWVGMGWYVLACWCWCQHQQHPRIIRLELNELQLAFSADCLAQARPGSSCSHQTHRHITLALVMLAGLAGSKRGRLGLPTGQARPSIRCQPPQGWPRTRVHSVGAAVFLRRHHQHESHSPPPTPHTPTPAGILSQNTATRQQCQPPQAQCQIWLRSTPNMSSGCWRLTLTATMARAMRGPATRWGSIMPSSR